MKKVLLKYYPFLLLLLLCVFYIYKAITFPIHDFSNYYFSGKFLADGHFNSKIYFPYEFNKSISYLGYQNVFANYAPNTPFLAFLFLPFSFVSPLIAKLVFNCISIALLVLSIYRLFSNYKINPKYALIIPVLFLVPIKNNLLFGQVYFLLFFLLTEGWLAYEKERWKSMAVFWSLAILLKVFPALLIVFLLFRKQWKALLYLGILGVLLFGISLIFTGIDIWIFYLKEVLPRASNGEISTAFVDNYQSVFMFLKRVFVYDSVENIRPVFNASGWFPVAIFAFKTGIILLGYFITRNSKNNFQIFSFWILAMILLSPYGSTYTFVLLLFSYFALLQSTVSNSKKVVLGGILFLINNLPLSFFIEKNFPFTYLRLFFLIVFAVFLVIVFFKTSALKKTIVIGCIAFFIGTFFKQSEPEKSKAILKNESAILIYDYEIKNNQLTYFYWNENGKNNTSVPFKSSSVKELELKENQIVCKRRALTSDISNKLKPILLEGKTVIYLSDYGRGIGFYTLRKIELP